MTTLILDLEARTDASMGEPPEGFPPLPYFQITTAAWLVIDMGRPVKAPGEVAIPPSATFGVAQGERHVLRTAAELLAKKPRLVTWNGRGFDLPLIALRSMKHRVPQRALLTKDGGDYLYRYGGLHRDLMDAVALLGAGKSSKQHDVALMLGLPGKHVGCGAEVEAMSPEQEAAYCLDDVAQLALTDCEWMRAQGHEVEHVRDLILGAIEAEPRLSALHAHLIGGAS